MFLYAIAVLDREGAATLSTEYLYPLLKQPLNRESPGFSRGFSYFYMR